MSYIPHTDADREAMLRVIGVESVEELFRDLPEQVRLKRELNIPCEMDEAAMLRHMRNLSKLNVTAEDYLSFLGAGIYDHFIPSVVDAIISRGEFATSYTPYQPELSQGMLQAIYEYQSLICRLTGMELSNASMYDAATALAEAALMSVEITGRKLVLVSETVHPNYRKVMETYLSSSGYTMHTLPQDDGATRTEALLNFPRDEIACVVIQNPNFFGALEEPEELMNAAHSAGALGVMCVDPISLGLLKPPGEYGADIVVGEGQGLGCPMGFGGPLLGFFACRLKFQRRFPGRIVGATTDTQGRRGYTMTLRTREQDIRRERATSNICTNEALLALAATVYLCEMGPKGLRNVAELCVKKANYAANRLNGLNGMKRTFSRPFFKEFALQLPAGIDVSAVNRQLLRRDIIGGYELEASYPEMKRCTLLCVTETRSRADIDRLVDSLREIIGDDHE